MTLATLRWLLVPTVVVLTTALAWLLVRSARRRSRRDQRVAASELRELIHDFIEGSCTATHLRFVARGAAGDVFWTALEGFGLGASRTEHRALGEALERIDHLKIERRALREEAPWRSELAARRLAILPGPLTRRALHAAMRSGPSLVTLACARALARQRDARALNWLLAHEDRLNPRTPRALSGLLRAFGRRASPALARHLEQTSGDPVFRRAILEVLGLARYAPARDVVVRHLDSPDLDVRIAATRALGSMTAPDRVDELFPLLRDSEWQVRAQAARGLGQVGAPEAMRHLAESLTDRAWWVRHHAAYALGRFGEPGRLVLAGVRDHSPDPYARDMADEVLRGGIR